MHVLRSKKSVYPLYIQVLKEEHIAIRIVSQIYTNNSYTHVRIIYFFKHKASENQKITTNRNRSSSYDIRYKKKTYTLGIVSYKFTY